MRAGIVARLPTRRSGPFTRARLRLTAWYAGLLVAVLTALGAGVYVLMTERLDAQVDAALEDEALAVAPRLALLTDPSQTVAPLPVVETNGAIVVPPEDESGEHPEHSDDEGALHELAEAGRVPTHQILLDLDGTPLESTIAIPPSPHAPAVAAARENGSDRRTLAFEGERVRLFTRIVRVDGEPVGYVQAFRSLEDRDATAADLLRVFLIVGGAAAALALVAGYWLSGRALAPIRRNMEAQERFVADASHELRTPIAVIQTSADVLLRHPDHRIADEDEVVRGIAEETGRMAALVRDLLDLGAGEQLRLDGAAVDLRAIAESAVRALTPAARAAGIELQIAEEAGVEVVGDQAALLQVARILVDNAITHCSSGATVQVSVRADGAHALLQVSDDGPGIDPADQERIFERFARVDKARARAAGNSGLGLAIARAIVERHGGTIDVVSTPGEGSAFSVRLPWSGDTVGRRFSPRRGLFRG